MGCDYYIYKAIFIVYDDENDDMIKYDKIPIYQWWKDTEDDTLYEKMIEKLYNCNIEKTVYENGEWVKNSYMKKFSDEIKCESKPIKRLYKTKWLEERT